jgi:hypothetical protein
MIAHVSPLLWCAFRENQAKKESSQFGRGFFQFLAAAEFDALALRDVDLFFPADVPSVAGLFGDDFKTPEPADLDFFVLGQGLFESPQYCFDD